MKAATKILAVILSGITLFYAGGITIAKHYCKAELIDLAINAPVAKCKGAAAEVAPPTGEGKTTFSKQSCCTDVFANFKTNTFNDTESGTALAVSLHADIPQQNPLQPLANGVQRHSFLVGHSPPATKQKRYTLFGCYLI